MNALKIQVKNGRLSFDEPTELPDGTVVDMNPTVKDTTKQLPWEQIKTLYPDEWVILVELLFNEPKEAYETKRVVGGVVFDHAHNRKELSARTKQALAGKFAAVFYTGEPSLR